MKSLVPLKRMGATLAALLGAVVSLEASAALAPLPRERISGTASFVSGGVSLGQAQTFEHAFRAYPLVVKLYEREGAREVYTADAEVTIRDAHGRAVLDRGVAQGPFLLVRLPAGEYRIEASLKGRALTPQHVHVSEHGHASRTFVFPAGTD